MPDPLVWTFTQLGGPRNQLKLIGWQAPFGRPRRGTIVNVGLHVGTQTTYFENGPPSVAVFGRQGKPWDLHGRWMDQAIGANGGAQQMARAWKDFIGARQEVRAAWGDILSYRIFIDDLDLNVESEAEIAWQMHAIVLVDEAAPITTQPQPVANPQEQAARLEVLMIDTREPFNVMTSTSIGAILNEISDEFADLVSTMNAPFAAIYETASAISSFETALSADLQKMGSGLQTLRTAAVEMADLNELLVSRTFVESGEIGLVSSDLSGGLFAGSDVKQLTSAKASADAATTDMLALIAEMQLAIELRLRGEAASAHAAQDGDTWEKIALRAMGSPEAARAVRAMNGAKYGAKPHPGRIYTIPKGG